MPINIDELAGLGRSKNPFLAKLLAEGMNTSPIASPWQGASRLAFALLSGVESGQEDRKEQLAEQAGEKTNQYLFGAPATGATPAAPQPTLNPYSGVMTDEPNARAS